MSQKPEATVSRIVTGDDLRVGDRVLDGRDGVVLEVVHVYGTADGQHIETEVRTEDGSVRLGTFGLDSPVRNLAT